MKKLNYFLLSLLAIFMLSCSRDSGEAPRTTALTKEKLFGTWAPTEIKVTGSVMGVPMTNQNFPIKENCEGKSRAVFKSDGTGSSLLYITSPLLNTCEELLDIKYTYTYNEGTKTVTTKDEDGIEEKIEIISATDTEIEVKQYMTNRVLMGIPFTGTVNAKFKKLP